MFVISIENLHRSGFKPRRPLEVISFTSEEPTRFGIGSLGRSETAFLYCITIGLLFVAIFINKSIIAFVLSCYLSISDNQVTSHILLLVLSFVAFVQPLIGWK